MNRPQQEFTFINVNASKKTNTRTIKRHVSNQTNRRKRQEAVDIYQRSLVQAVEQSDSRSETSSSSDHQFDHLQPTVLPLRAAHPSKEVNSPSELESSEHEDEYQEFGSPRQTGRRQFSQIKDFWPAYQKWAMRNLKTSSSPEQSSNATRSSRKVLRFSPEPSHSRLFVTMTNQSITIHIPRIDDPSEFSRIRWALQLSSSFIRETYETEWAPVWQGKQWYEGSLLPLGIWRECFPLAVEFINSGKFQEAFFLLDAALSVTPAFFKENHPGLLITLLGAMMYTCQIKDERLSTLIRCHITQLAWAHLGPKHPISQLLREQMRASEPAHGRADYIPIAVLDTFSDVFGPTHFVPLGMRFGYSRRQTTSGQYDAALASIAILQKVWNIEAMPATQLPKFVAFEKAKILDARSKAPSSRPHLLPAPSQELVEVAEKSIQLPVFIPGHGPVLQPTDSVILKKLGIHLLLNSHYALALYIYTRIPEVFAETSSTDPLSTTNQDPNTLPLTASRILVNHLKNVMKDDLQEQSSLK